MDGVDIFMNMGFMEEQREWRKEERLWRKEDRNWRMDDLQHRREERKWRRNDRRYRQLDEIRRKTDEWVEMINDIANMSALLAGFATAALVEAPLDDIWQCLGDKYEYDSSTYYNADGCSVGEYGNNYRITIGWVITFAVSTSMVAALMTGNVVAAVQTGTLLLQNYSKYPWRKHKGLWDMIDDRWRWITIRFYIGMILSLISLASLVVLKFANSSYVCWSAVAPVVLISIWIFNDAVGCCYCCCTWCICCFPACCKQKRRCGCCDAPACVVMSSTIQSSYTKHPLKGYYQGDIYDFEEDEDNWGENSEYIQKEKFDLDEYKTSCTKRDIHNDDDDNRVRSNHENNAGNDKRDTFVTPERKHGKQSEL
jgi:hypothetical protein